MARQMQVTMIEPSNAEQLQSTADQASSLLKAGGLVVFPTETVYGVGASAASDRGIQALRQLKQTDPNASFTVHLPTPAAAERYVDLASPTLKRLVHKLFPGPVTLVVEVAEEIIDQKLKALGLPPGSRDRLYRGNLVALRCPDHAVTQRILGAIDAPVVAASANRPGQSPPHEAGEAAEALDGDVDLVVDGGRSRYAKPSTVVRLAGRGAAQAIHVDREGVYDERYIRKLLRWTMVLVCSGNTCRSPMAEAMAKQMLAEQRGLAIDELDAAGLRVISAGVAATAGMPANPQAIDAMAKQGLDVTRHRSRPLSPELIHDADVIYTMTESHRRAVLDLVPAAEDKTVQLDPNGDIEDPIGSGATSYQRTAEVIRRRLAQRLKEQQP